MERGFVNKLWKNPVETQREKLAAAGVKVIYEQGKGGEDLDSCLMAFRGRGGTIKIAADLRVFGDSQASIAEAASKCEQAKVSIVDVAHPEFKTIAAHLKHAFAQVAFMRRWDGDKAKARRVGREGGHGKAKHQAAKRTGLMDDAAVRRLIAKVGKKLTWRDIEEVTTISTATLRRHYL